MKFYSIAIREHEEYCGNGIVILNNDRDYFEPAVTGLTLAHDILEHTVTPHEHGFTDELMALGGVIAGRIEGGWCNKYGRSLDIEDISSDIYALANSAYCEDDLIDGYVCNSKLQDSFLMQSIYKMVRDGLTEAAGECAPEDEDIDIEKFIKENYIIDNIVGWICKGYQKHKKRFAKMYSHDYVNLFRKIAKTCDGFMSREESQYNSHKLCIDYTNCRVWIETEYDEDY